MLDTSWFAYIIGQNMKVSMMFTLFLFAVLALLAYIRLAPSDPAVWNIALNPRPAILAAPSPDAVVTLQNSAYMDLPVSSFAALKSVAASTPRTQILAQTPDHITWITRSKLIGYPDYTTAQITSSGLTVYARQRFGSGDWGVNAARLTAWRAALNLP
jgi:uncharacterized protein (DUF1499 family)